MSIKNEKKPISIFISSTYKDLAQYRSEVEKQLLGLEQAVKGMEYFGASSEKPLDVCLRKIKECQLMILILGVSYGSVEPIHGKSYTELEYECAIESNIPVLVYMADLSSPNIEIPIDTVDYEHIDQLNQFKDRVKNAHVVSTFGSVDDLGKRILHDIPSELERMSLIKSIPQNSIAPEVNEEMLKDGANTFERFWLRPQRFAGKLIPVRLRVNKRFSGWKVKDELITAVGLTVGDSITTEVSVQCGGNIIDDDGDTDLFADGAAADWLLDQTEHAGGAVGCILDCFVRLVYCRAPVGINNRMINKASLVLVDGIRYVGVDTNYVLASSASESRIDADYSKLFRY